MKKFVIIGLGNFGYTLATELFDLGHYVQVIENNEAIIDRIKDHVSHAMIADAREPDVLKDLIDKDIDAAILNLGDSLEDSILVTMILKELGVQNIIVKVINEAHGRILKRLGASEIVIPENNYAIQMAQKLTTASLLDYISMSPEYGVYEIVLPEKFMGKRLDELDLRRRYKLNVIAVKDILHDTMILNPGPEFVIPPDSLIYFFGKHEDILRIKKILNR